MDSGGWRWLRARKRHLASVAVCVRHGRVDLVAATGLALAVLHGIEAAIWAAAYLWLGALGSPLDAILYSVDSMSTRGASGLALEGHWRMMGALEAVDGMLLFGISTGYIFALMQAYWSMFSRRR